MSPPRMALAVDDDHGLRPRLRRLLEMGGYRVFEGWTALEALRMIETGQLRESP